MHFSVSRKMHNENGFNRMENLTSGIEGGMRWLQRKRETDYINEWKKNEKYET